MKRSTNRFLTTHVGSLVRPPKLLDLLRSGEDSGPHLAGFVAEIVRRQRAVGVDIVSDGEFGKSISWSMYALDRLSGFERRPIADGADPFPSGADRARFKEFYAELEQPGDRTWSKAAAHEIYAVGPIAYTGLDELHRDIANLKAAAGGEEAFLPVAAPSSAIPDRKNEYYKTDDELAVALAEALRTEYRAIVDSGLLLQIDDARLAVTYDRTVPPASFEDYHRWATRQVEILNYALEGIPEDRVRYHVCWGSWPGPHSTDVPLRKIVDLILKVNAGAYLIEAANARHEHEWRVWKEVRLPEGKILVPGVVTHSTNVVEHPELVAERIARFANAVGWENVIAGTDCGFSQSPFNRRVHPSIMWAKLEALAEGARIASHELFGNQPAADLGHSANWPRSLSIGGVN